MRGGQLTPREKGIIRDLLAERGITIYEIVDAVNEGRELPGCTYFYEIELLLGQIVTPTGIYGFLLDWVDGKYTLGDETGNWRELRPEDVGEQWQQLSQIQQQLREREQR